MNEIQDVFILYVEDNASNRKVMSLLMEKALATKNYVIFEDSTDFIQRVRGLGLIPEIILLDIHVSPLDGFEMLNQLRADKTFNRVKVLALTASVMNEEVQKLRDSGFDGAIAKPVNIRVFPDQIKSILKGEEVWSVT